MCKFVYRESDIPDFSFGLGLWGWVDRDGECMHFIDYPLLNNNLNLNMRAGKGFMFAADVLGFFGMLFLCCTALFPLDARCIRGLGIFMWLCTLFQGLTFLIFRAPLCDVLFVEGLGPDQVSEKSVNCVLDIGAKLSISATVCYFVAALSTCAVPSPIDDTSREAQPKSEGKSEPKEDKSAPKEDEESKSAQPKEGTMSELKDVEAQKPEQAKDFENEAPKDEKD